MNEEMIVAGELISTPADLIAKMLELRHDADFQFDRLLDVTAVDRGNALEIVYRLNSLKTDRDFVVRVSLPADDPRLPSVSGIWQSALFGEREAQDMFGVVFEGHPDPRPLLAPEEGFGFFPLRKNYTLPGRAGNAGGRCV